MALESFDIISAAETGISAGAKSLSQEQVLASLRENQSAGLIEEGTKRKARTIPRSAALLKAKATKLRRDCDEEV